MIGYIYSIVCNETGEVYYGSTTKSVEERIQQHRWDCATWKNGGKKNYCSSYSIIERDNYTVNTIETVEYEERKEILEIEKVFIRNNPCINRGNPISTAEERKEYYRQRNATERKKETNRIWRENNKERVIEINRKADKKRREKNKNGGEPTSNQQLHEGSGEL